MTTLDKRPKPDLRLLLTDKFLDLIVALLAVGIVAVFVHYLG